MHRSGQKHSNADGLSRIEEDEECDCYLAGRNVSTLPCRGCRYCLKIHDMWDKYEEEVDDVLPLAFSAKQEGEAEPKISFGMSTIGVSEASSDGTSRPVSLGSAGKQSQLTGQITSNSDDDALDSIDGAVVSEERKASVVTNEEKGPGGYQWRQ